MSIPDTSFTSQVAFNLNFSSKSQHYQSNHTHRRDAELLLKDIKGELVVLGDVLGLEGVEVE